MDNTACSRVRALFATVLVLSVATLGVAGAVGSGAAVWIRDTIVIVIAIVLLMLASRAQRGSRRAYLRMLLMVSLAPVAIVAIIVIPHAGFPFWMKVEQAVVGVLLVAAAAVLNRKTVRSAFPKARTSFPRH